MIIMYEISEELLEHKKKKPFSEEDKKKMIASFKKIKDNDKILLLLSHIRGQEIISSKPMLHRAFFELKKIFPQHFANFYFTTNENYPFCKKIDDIFSRFQNCRALSMKNPTYESYLISEGIRQMIREEIQPRMEEENELFMKDLNGMIEIVKDHLEYHE